MNSAPDSTQHRLAALHGSSPLGFLAALGTLVVADRRRELGGARLAWEPQPPHAALLTTTAATSQVLAEAVFAGLTDGEAPTPEQVTGTANFKHLTVDLCRAQFEQLSATEAALLGALVSDVTREERPRRGPLVMTGGPQDFTLEVKKLRAAVRAGGVRRIEQALFGPWAYEDGHPLGFDPLMERAHAYLAAKPERDAQRVPGAVLLAIAALELLSLRPVRGRAAIANALFRDADWEAMTWPLWTEPLTPPAVASLLAVDGGAGERAAGGVVARFAAERKEVKTAGGSYPVLRQGRRVA